MLSRQTICQGDTQADSQLSTRVNMAAILRDNAPLVEQLRRAVDSELVGIARNIGLSSLDNDVTNLTELIMNMLIDGRTQEDVSSKLSRLLFSSNEEVFSARSIAAWFFRQADNLISAAGQVAPAPAQETPPAIVQKSGYTTPECNKIDKPESALTELRAPSEPYPIVIFKDLVSSEKTNFCARQGEKYCCHLESAYHPWRIRVILMSSILMSQSILLGGYLAYPWFPLVDRKTWALSPRLGVVYRVQ